MTGLSNKYGKNSKNNKFNEILHLEREKAKKGLEKAVNFEKIATKVTRILIAIIKNTLINIESIPIITDFANVHTCKEQR